MKTFTKISLAVSGVCLVAGIGLCISGVALGYRPGNLLGRHQEMAALKEESGDKFSYTQEYKDISLIKLSVGAADCRIQGYDGDCVLVEAASSRLIDCKQSGDSLKISYGEEESLIPFLKEEEGRIRVFIPQNQELKALKLEGGAANIAAEDISCEEVDMEVGAGAFTYKGSVSKKIAVECGLGSARLSVEGEAQDFDYTLECGLGSVTVEDGPYILGIGEERMNNQAEKKMELDCGMGNIEVTFWH